MIADRKIGLVQARDIDKFTANGMQLTDGTLIEGDLIVLATGYKNQQEEVRRLFGDEIADTVGPVWGFDDSYFMKNMWRPTAQEGLWIMGGSLIECRQYSRYLALFIKATLEELRPAPFSEKTPERV